MSAVHYANFYVIFKPTGTNFTKSLISRLRNIVKQRMSLPTVYMYSIGFQFPEIYAGI